MNTTHNNICNITFPLFYSPSPWFKTIDVEMELVQRRKKKERGKGANGKHATNKKGGRKKKKGLGVVATLLWAKCGGEAQHSQSWELGVLRDSRMFRVRQQGLKHLALRRSWCHWKGLEA